MNLLFITLLSCKLEKCFQFAIEDKMYLNMISSLNTSNKHQHAFASTENAVNENALLKYTIK